MPSLRFPLLWLTILIHSFGTGLAREWRSADGRRTFEGQLVEYRPPNVTVLQDTGERMTFSDSILSPIDKQYCVIAKGVLAKSYASIPYRVVQTMANGCIAEELARGNPLYSHETMMIWADRRIAVLAGGTYETDIFWAGSYHYTTPEGRRVEIRSFALTLDQAVSIWQGGGASASLAPHAPPPPGRSSFTPPSPPKEKHGDGSGSCFAITSTGYLITNAHVVDHARTIIVTVRNVEVPAELLTIDRVNDLAIIKIACRTIPLKMAFDDPAKLGDEVMVGGFPNPEVQGTSLKLTRGVISSTSGLHDDARHFQIDASVQPGNSGGPLLNTRGSVVGVVNARIDDAVAIETTGMLPQNVNFAIKASLLPPFIRTVVGLAKAMAAETFETGLSNGDWLERSTYLVRCKGDSM